MDIHSALAEQDRRSFNTSQVAAIFIHNLFILILFTFQTTALNLSMLHNFIHIL